MQISGLHIYPILIPHSDGNTIYSDYVLWVSKYFCPPSTWQFVLDSFFRTELDRKSKVCVRMSEPIFEREPNFFPFLLLHGNFVTESLG